MELELWMLDSEYLLQAAKEGYVIFLDTKGYFDPTDDTNNYQKSLVYGKLIHRLLNAGSPGVIGLMHPPKYASKDEAKENRWTLENSNFGTVGYSGILRSCLRMKNLKPDLNDPAVWVYVQGLKNPDLKPFQLRGPVPLWMDGEYGSSPYLWELLKSQDASGDPRRAEAFVLFEQDMSPKEIAKRLKARPETVYQWKKDFMNMKEQLTAPPEQGSLIDENDAPAY
jgi:hypothetical protein